MTRALVALAVSMAVLIIAPAAAMAVPRYAGPAGLVVTGCPKANPCEIHEAIENAGPNDEVIILPGDYGSTSSPLTLKINSTQTGLNVHGEDGQPRPRIFINTGPQVPAFSLTGAGSKARHLEVHSQGPVGSKQSALLLDNTEASDIVARTVASEGRACILLHTSLLTNSLCEATATNAKGIATYEGVGPGVTNNSVLRNVTAIATNTASVGIEAFAGYTAGQDQNLTVTNAIARGQPNQTDVAANNATSSGGSNAVITIDHSNFGFELSFPPGSGDRVVDGPGGGNQRTFSGFAVNFVAAGNFHQAANSPTIDKGATNVLNGPVDFDGDPRALGQSTDIGADEFVPTPTAVTGGTTGVTTSKAVLNGTVNPNAVATTYHFDYGPTSGYGSSTPETDAGAGNANVAAAATITGLARNTTYHYRVVATNRAGTTAGADRTLTTGTGTGGGGGGGPLQSLGLSPRTFAAAASGGSVKAAPSRRRAAVGTTVTFQLSAAATVGFTVQRPRPGRRVGGRCVKPSKRNRRARKCTRYVRVRGSFSVAGVAGQNRFRFTGRLRRHKLPVGRYRLVASAAGGRLTTSFKIVRR